MPKTARRKPKGSTIDAASLVTGRVHHPTPAAHRVFASPRLPPAFHTVIDPDKHPPQPWRDLPNPTGSAPFRLKLESVLSAESIQTIGAGGVVCLTGVGSGGRPSGLSTADVAAEVVLQNNVIVGSVNANRRHWYKASEALARADRSWLGRLVTRSERPEDFAQALLRREDDIKVVVQFAEV